MINKVLVYLKLLAFLCLTISIILGIDYNVLLNNTKDIVPYCFILSNSLICCFYYVHKFYELFK